MLCEKWVLWGNNFGEYCTELSSADLFCCGPSQNFPYANRHCAVPRMGVEYIVFIKLIWSWGTLPLPFLASHLKGLAFHRMYFGNCILAWNCNWPGRYQWKGKVFSYSSKDRQCTIDLHLILTTVILKVSCAFTFFFFNLHVAELSFPPLDWISYW